MKYVGIVLLIGTLIAALLLIFSPFAPYAGERHNPHERAQRIVLRPGEQIGQTFRMEGPRLTSLAVWVDTTQGLPRSGDLELEVQVGERRVGARYPLATIPSSGIVVFGLQSPLVAQVGDEGQYLLGVSGSDTHVTLQFQIDAHKYEDGHLIHPNATKQGDLAFQLFYTRPALQAIQFQLGYAIILILCGVAMWQSLRTYPHLKRKLERQDVLLAVGSGIAVAFFYGMLLLRSGYWMAPTDFTKDASYLASGAQALKTFAWPLWHHLTCGGLPLMGNIESNVISLGTIFALFSSPVHALMLLNIVEAGIAAAGAYVLSRFFGATRIGSMAAMIIYALSPVYIFKISVGYSMLGALVAFAPWALVCFGMSLKRKDGYWAIISGLILGMIVLRGEAHVVIVLAALMGFWALYEAIARKRMYPLMLLVACGSMALFVSSIKILPYIEHLGSEKIILQPYVAPLLRNNLLLETLFTVQPHHESVSVLHGKFGEVWGAFGSYVGVVPVLLALIGIFGKKRGRGVLSMLLLCSLLFAEGTLFEYVLRFAPPLDALLRLPARNMILVVLCIALAAARGIDSITERIHHPFWRRGVQGAALAFLCINLGYATSSVAYTTMHYAQLSNLTFARDLRFMDYEVDGQETENANVLLDRGYLLPQVCADQDRTVAFIKSIPDDAPLASVDATLKPNAITLHMPSGVRDVVVKERFSNLWTSRSAFVFEEADEGSLHVIPHVAEGGEVVLEQFSPTKRVQQMIAITIFLYLTCMVLYENVRVWFNAKRYSSR